MVLHERCESPWSCLVVGPALDLFVGRFDPGTPGSLCEDFLLMEGFRSKMSLPDREMVVFPRTSSVCQSGVEVAVRAFIQLLGALSMRCTLLQHLCHSQSGADPKVAKDGRGFPMFSQSQGGGRGRRRRCATHEPTFEE